ncbi:hypothetical protein [Acinetobacter sp. FDAARGOS_515]|uniref:hypothetical protein n=1 Tax=Acinetobacter sp. FDAARGOS_515 TaxID=2420307 RepID=UPI000F690271|nr:hypothetical protein [Acinetobacter sp. FDAARGOS_515]RSC30356.1 hypothetical protein EGS47_01130 [Acinetobacter sp. FDAARGOS_515]
MSKTLFNLVAVILISSLLSACNNSNTPKEHDPLKGQEQKFLDESAANEPKELVFYDLVDPKKKDQPLKTEEASASEPGAQEQQPENALSPEVLEAIRENAERQQRKENALRTIAEAKRIEDLLVGKDRSSDDGYTYNSDE